MPRFKDAVALGDVLTAPEVESAELTLPSQWQAWDALFQKIRDGINDFLSAADKVPGINPPRLPDGSLEELVIKPFCGDWDRIRANGVACASYGEGISGLGQNLATIPADMEPYWSGSARTAFAAHHVSYGVALDGVGGVVAQGQRLFEGMASVSQGLAQRAIAAITRLGQLLARVSSGLAKRMGGWLAWINTLKDIVTDGLDSVRDLYDGIIEIVGIVGDLIELKSTVQNYVGQQVAKFRRFTDLEAIMERIPTIGTATVGGLGRTRPGDRRAVRDIERRHERPEAPDASEAAVRSKLAEPDPGEIEPCRVAG